MNKDITQKKNLCKSNIEFCEQYKVDLIKALAATTFAIDEQIKLTEIKINKFKAEMLEYNKDD